MEKTPDRPFPRHETPFQKLAREIRVALPPEPPAQVPRGLEPPGARMPDYVNGLPRKREAWELPPVMSVPSYPPKAPPPAPPRFLPLSARGRPKFPPFAAEPEPTPTPAPDAAAELAPPTPDADKD